MRAKWLDALRGILPKSDDMAFGPVFLVFREADIDDIPGYCVLDENYLSVHPGKGLAFRGVILYQDRC
jgi:hypothetical protein